jgi:hypothetical protein
VSLEEFISSIESAAKIGLCEDIDKFEFAVLKLTDSAKLFYQGCAELHAQDASWQTFKKSSGKSTKTSVQTSTIS